MLLFELVLKEFLFPDNLPNRNANFRFIVDLRFINDKGHFTTEHAVMPGLDTFWECDKDQTDMPNYVRDSDHSQFNMEKIDDWDRLILCVKAQAFTPSSSKYLMLIEKMLGTKCRIFWRE